MILSENESIFCQALAMTSLLNTMSNNNFLESTYFNKLRFDSNEDNIRKILSASGLGNPATMQMLLYILLVMPREVLNDTNDSWIHQCSSEINTLVASLVQSISTTYPNESAENRETINYYRHIRNAVAHSKCSYKTINNTTHVTFTDQNPHNIDQRCEITIATSNVGIILGCLQNKFMEYLNAHWVGR
jgi:hypothetical protein